MSGGHGDEQHCLIPNSRQACGGLSHVSDLSGSVLSAAVNSSDLLSVRLRSPTKYSTALYPVSGN